MRDMKANKNKMKFNYVGMTFEVPSTCLRTTDYWGKPLANPIIKIGRKEAPLMFKQYVKTKYPTLLVWGSSSVFANGDSADLYVCNADGSDLEFSSPILNDLRKFSQCLEGGRYDGMHDIYEYSDSSKTDNGTTLEFNSKYVHFNGKAPFASWPDAKRMLVDLMAGKYVWGVLSLEQAIEKVKSYGVTDSNLNKALSLI